MKMTNRKKLIILVTSGCLAGLNSCMDHKEALYSSIVIMPEKSSTEGVEGPAVDASGTLYWVNYDHESSIGMMKAGEKPEVFIDLPEGSDGNGIRFDSRGNMLVADYKGHNILKINTKTKEISVLAHEGAMSQPNDIAIDNRDRVYASDPDWSRQKGRIWRIDPSGSVTLLDSLGTANGIEVSPDNKTLFVNASGKVFAYDINEDGSVSGKREIISFADGGMDGMRCDVSGNIYIARYGQSLVAKISPDGRLLKEVNLTGKCPTNVAFGGSDGRTIYVTLQDKGNLESFRVEEPGREWKMQKERADK
jgi:gluconolactonase